MTERNAMGPFGPHKTEYLEAAQETEQRAQCFQGGIFHVDIPRGASAANRRLHRLLDDQQSQPTAYHQSLHPLVGKDHGTHAQHYDECLRYQEYRVKIVKQKV